MGDVLRTKAILPALKRAYPVSWVVWLTEPGSEPIVRDPLVDEIRTMTPAGLAALEGRQYELLICLDKDAQAVSISARLNAREKRGFAPTAYNSITVWNDAAMYALRLGLSDELKYRQNEKSMPAIVAEAAGLPYEGERYTLTVSNEGRREAAAMMDRLFAGNPITSATKIIGLNTGCGPVFATKGWSARRMSEFLRLIESRPEWRVVLLGGKREASLHRELMEASGPLAGRQVFDSGTDNSLEGLFGLIERMDAVLSADSLAMHVAVALSKPVVAWFGPTCHQEIDLFGRGEKIVTDFPCSPCYLKTCPKPVFCLDALDATQVLAATERVLR
jgi:heptosyltransferase-2